MALLCNYNSHWLGASLESALVCVLLRLSYGQLYPYPSGSLHWHWGNHMIAHWGNHMIAPVPVKLPWMVWVGNPHLAAKNDDITPLWSILFSYQFGEPQLMSPNHILHSCIPVTECHLHKPLKKHFCHIPELKGTIEWHTRWSTVKCCSIGISHCFSQWSS